jgi:hypothetical protein
MLAGSALFPGLLSQLLADSTASDPLAARPAHFPAKAKRVIFLFMNGGVSHVDSWDPKPLLFKNAGQSVAVDEFQGRKGDYRMFLTRPLWEFQPHGQCGTEVSALFPHTAKCVDDICVIRSMRSDHTNHYESTLGMHTGSFNFARPSIGSWVLYGLGTDNANLPGFVSIAPPANNGGTANYGSCFLPAIYQGTRLGQAGRPMANARMANIAGGERRADRQRTQLDVIQEFNRQATPSGPTDPLISGLMDSFELAYRMQGEMPPLLDISAESASTKSSYGLDDASSRNFGHQCLLARRLLEAGVRFVEICQPGWDHHRGLQEALTNSCRAIDKPMSGLLGDLAARGLLEDTLVIWSGEFGRTPTSQGGDGRDHNSKGYTMWMAGGGVKAGHVHGATDELGFEAVSGRMHVHDWHATMLHLLGLDHERLTYRHAGREMRLTDVKGQVEHGILA